MKKKLRRLKGVWHYGADGKITAGPNPRMTNTNILLYGDCTNLRGDCKRIWGNCSSIAGDCTGVWGDCSGLFGDLDLCELTPEERALDEIGICTTDLVDEDEFKQSTIITNHKEETA